MSDPRILFFDIETTNLDLDFGYCLCIGHAWNDEPVNVLQADMNGKAYDRDRTMLREFYRTYNEADMVVTFFGKEFDWKAVQTRGYLAEAGPLPPTPHVDLYYTAKRNFKLHSGRLESLAQFLKCPYPKSPVDGPTWVNAMCGDEDAQHYVVEHCLQDVEILRWSYQTLRGYVRQHPAIFARGSAICRSCGGRRIQSRGFARRLLTNGTAPKKEPTLVRRVQCQDCGRWSLAE